MKMNTLILLFEELDANFEQYRSAFYKACEVYEMHGEKLDLEDACSNLNRNLTVLLDAVKMLEQAVSDA